MGKISVFMITTSPLMQNLCHKPIFYVLKIRSWSGRFTKMHHHF